MSFSQFHDFLMTLSVCCEDLFEQAFLLSLFVSFLFVVSCQMQRPSAVVDAKQLRDRLFRSGGKRFDSSTPSHVKKPLPQSQASSHTQQLLQPTQSLSLQQQQQLLQYQSLSRALPPEVKQAWGADEEEAEESNADAATSSSPSGEADPNFPFSFIDRVIRDPFCEAFVYMKPIGPYSFKQASFHSVLFLF